MCVLCCACTLSFLVHVAYPSHLKLILSLRTLPCPLLFKKTYPCPLVNQPPIRYTVNHHVNQQVNLVGNPVWPLVNSQQFNRHRILHNSPCNSLRDSPQISHHVNPRHNRPNNPSHVLPDNLPVVHRRNPQFALTYAPPGIAVVIRTTLLSIVCTSQSVN